MSGRELRGGVHWIRVGCAPILLSDEGSRKEGFQDFMKRVLAVSYYAPPIHNAESILVWKTLRALSQYHHMSLVTAPSYANENSELIFPLQLHIIRKPDAKPTDRTLRRIFERALGMIADENILWSRFTRESPWIQHDFDVVYSRSQPGASHIMAWKIKKMIHKPWIAQFSDPWANNPYHTKRTRLRQKSDRHWEECVVRDADMLIFPTEELSAIYEESYPQLNVQSKSMILPHHYTPELYGDGFSVSNSDDRSTVLRYFGEFYGIRSPEPLIRALSYFAQSDPDLARRVKIEFVGNVESKFSNLLRNSPIPIRVDKMSYLESLRSMRNTDVLLLIDAPSPNGVNIFLPSKLIDYLGAAKPIFAITDQKGTTSEILRQYGHSLCSHDDIQGIVAVLQRIMQDKPMHFSAPLEFATNNVVARLADLIERLG